MKVLFISNFYDNTGWAQQGIASILALDSAGVEVVPRAIKLNGVAGEVPSRIRELEERSDKNPDVVIQNVLPQFCYYSGAVRKNIVYYQSETSNFKQSGWSENINMMDEAWVFCAYGHKAAKNSGVTVPVNIVPMPTNIDTYGVNYGIIDNVRESVGDNGFIFYTISEFTERKNIKTILQAFHSEFHLDEPVYLLIKTTDAAYGNKIGDRIKDVVDGVKRDLRIYSDLSKYKKEMIICGHVNQKELYKLHQTCDAFVSASHAEGWCLPAFDACGFGKIIVAPRHTAFTEYLNNDNAYLVDCYEDACYAAHDTLSGLYTSNENWYEVPVINLRKQMRAAYEQRKGLAAKRAEVAKRTIAKYNYYNVGRQMKTLLEQ